MRIARSVSAPAPSAKRTIRAESYSTARTSSVDFDGGNNDDGSAADHAESILDDDSDASSSTHAFKTRRKFASGSRLSSSFSSRHGSGSSNFSMFADDMTIGETLTHLLYVNRIEIVDFTEDTSRHRKVHQVWNAHLKLGTAHTWTAQLRPSSFRQLARHFLINRVRTAPALPNELLVPRFFRQRFAIAPA